MESMPSETTMSTGGEDVEVELEDLAWSLMQKSGFLSDLKARIFKFLEQNGHVVQEVNVMPGRANETMLQLIFDYLNWVGMTNTCAALAVESPVDLDLSKTRTEEEPILHKMFSEEKKFKIGGGGPAELSPVPQVPLNQTYNVAVDGAMPMEGSLLRSEAQPPHGEVTEDCSLSSAASANGLSEPEVCLHQFLPSNAVQVEVEPKKSGRGVEGSGVGNVSVAKVGDDSLLSSMAEDSSISDLSLDINLNTEDASLPSNSNGMSSAEHHVNLKSN